ncbi:hypothetical protein EV2_003993 [Malus domestica]
MILTHISNMSILSYEASSASSLHMPSNNGNLQPLLTSSGGFLEVLLQLLKLFFPLTLLAFNSDKVSTILKGRLKVLLALMSGFILSLLQGYLV